MNKCVLNKIIKLEQLFPIKDYNVKDCIENLVTEIEGILGYNIHKRIDLKNINFKNKDMIERSILMFLTIEELRYIAYYNTQEKTVRT